MAYADITVNYKLRKGATNYVCFPVVKEDQTNGTLRRYTVQEIARIVENATSETVQWFSQGGGAFAYQDITTGEWSLSGLRYIDPSKGYVMYLNGSASIGTIGITFANSNWTTSLTGGDYTAGEDYKYPNLSFGNNFISYPFNTDRSFTDVWADTSATYFNTITTEYNGSAERATNTGSGWSGDIVDNGFRAGQSYWIRNSGGDLALPLQNHEVFQYHAGASTSGGVTYDDLNTDNGVANKDWFNVTQSQNQHFMLFHNDGSPNTQGILDINGSPIGKGSKVFSIKDDDSLSNASFIYGMCRGIDERDRTNLPNHFLLNQGYMERYQNDGAEQCIIANMGDDGAYGPSSGFAGSGDIVYRCWESRSGKFFKLVFKNDSGVAISDTFTAQGYTVATGGNLSAISPVA